MSRDMSHRQFLTKLKDRNIHYKNGTFTIVSEYVDYATPLIVKDSNGLIHSMRSSSLFNGGIPKFQTSLNKTEHITEELKRNRADFKNGVLSIIGEFKDKDTSILVKGKYGIMLANISQLRRGNTPTIESAVNKEEYFSELLREKNLNIYNQVKVINYINFSKVLMQTKYGVVKGNVNSIFRWTHVGIESAVNRSDFWIKRNKDVVENYNNIDYSLATYINNKTKVKLRCKIHNIQYEQVANHHLENTQGCPKCTKQIIRYTEGTVETNKEFFSNINGYLYVLQLSNETENFIKVGICAKHRLQYRINAIKRAYKVELLYDREMNMVEAYHMEQKILKEFAPNFKYIPHIKFKGYTECLTENPLNYIYNE